MLLIWYNTKKTEYKYGSEMDYDCEKNLYTDVEVIYKFNEDVVKLAKKITAQLNLAVSQRSGVIDVA
ncbi:MAG TPA: hypothetical protein ACFCUD_12640 [Cyclobacteriaceae bacterium]